MSKKIFYFRKETKKKFAQYFVPAVLRSIDLKEPVVHSTILFSEATVPVNYYKFEIILYTLALNLILHVTDI